MHNKIQSYSLGRKEFTILSLLPILCWFFIFLTFAKKGFCWRSSFLFASIVWGLLLTAETEILSIFKLLTFEVVAIFWGVATVIALITYHYCLKREIPKERTVLSAFLKSLLAGIAIISALTVMIAIIAPPNTWDSMTYHMSRVIHWIQNKSVAHYPTHILRQLHQGPWAEFAIAHLQILSGGDYLANLIQWFGAFGSLIGVSLIAKQLGTDLRGQIFASTVCATIPMGILQASSTQTDYVVSFWLVCFAYSVVLLNTNINWKYIFAANASLGLALLTKGTAYIYAFPFLIWFGFLLIKTFKWRLWKPILLSATVVLLINAGHFQRNFDLYGSPLGPGGEGLPGHKYSNDVFTTTSLLSNISRNLALHIVTPYEKINKIVKQTVGFFHKSIGADLNDPGTTWQWTTFDVPKISFNENGAGNPAHLILIMASIAFCLFNKELRQFSSLQVYLCSLVVGFLLFCFYLRWQPWHSRLHLPLFVLGSPLIAMVLSRSLNRRVADFTIVVLLVISIPWLLFNSSRPIVGKKTVLTTARMEQYFNTRPLIKESFENAVSLINTQKCSNIGLHLGGDAWEYPLWVLLNTNRDQTYRIEHVDVNNASGRIPLNDFIPCAIVNIGNDGKVVVDL